MSIDNKILQNRMSNLIFKLGMFYEVIDAFEPIHVRRKWFSKEIIGYRCKLDSSRVAEGDRLKHYAECHYNEARKNLKGG